MFKFLHAADIHLDSPLRGIARYEGMPVDDIRMATRRAFDNLVRLAIAERVRFVLLAGDLYDGDWKDTSTGMFFAARMTRLREAGIPVFLAAGNHDAANRMTKSLRLPENVTFFPDKNAESVEKNIPPGKIISPGKEKIALLAAALRTLPDFVAQHLRGEGVTLHAAEAVFDLPNVHANQKIAYRYPVDLPELASLRANRWR